MKTCILSIFGSDLDSSYVRSIMQDPTVYNYIEISDNFYISADADDIDRLSAEVFALGIPYILVYIYSITGNWVSNRGISEKDQTSLRKIINHRYKY